MCAQSSLTKKSFINLFAEHNLEKHVLIIVFFNYVNKEQNNCFKT